MVINQLHPDQTQTAGNMGHKSVGEIQAPVRDVNSNAYIPKIYSLDLRRHSSENAKARRWVGGSGVMKQDGLWSQQI